MTDSFWGDMIEKTINFGREDNSSKLKKIIPKTIGFRYKDFTHCCHVMIYSKTESEYKTFSSKALILMQMQSDGCVGFPGGIVGKDENPLQAICREVEQKVGWTEEKGPISESHYQFTHLDNENELFLHFYAVEVSKEKLKEIELNLPKASDFGTEVLGHFRVPLYTMGDAFRGFPAFLKNHFVKNAKLQLIEAIVNLNLLTEEQIIQALNSAPNITY